MDNIYGIFRGINFWSILMPVFGIVLLFGGSWKMFVLMRNFRAYRIKKEVADNLDSYPEKVVKFFTALKVVNMDMALKPKKYLNQYACIIFIGVLLLMIFFYDNWNM